MSSLDTPSPAAAGSHRPDRTLLGDRRAGVAVFIALFFPMAIALGLLAVDGVRAYSQASQINFATQAAALAAGSQLGDYYSQGATAGGVAIQAAATTISNANFVSLANVTNRSATVTLGRWDSTNSTFTVLGEGTNPNAAKVVGQGTINTILGGAFGIPTLPVTKIAVATLGTPGPFNIVVLNDMGANNSKNALGGVGGTSGAQSQLWAQQQAADQAILKCIQNSGNTSSKMGVIGFIAQGYVVQSLKTVNSGSNAATIKSAISSATYCAHDKAQPQCYGTNVAGGIYAAISQFSGVTGNNNILIITNQEPLSNNTGNPIIYTASDGTKTVVTNYQLTMGTGVSVANGVGTGSSATALCGNSPTCTSAMLLEMAEGQAAAAGAAGITVSVVYFSGDSGTPSGSANAYYTEMSGWVKNGGLAQTTSTLSAVPGLAGNVCRMIGATLQVASQ